MRAVFFRLQSILETTRKYQIEKYAIVKCMHLSKL